MTYLIAGCLCGQRSFLRSARVRVGLSPGCLAVVGKEMIPHQLAGEEAAERWSARAMGPETCDGLGGTDSKTATLAAIGRNFDG